MDLDLAVLMFWCMSELGEKGGEGGAYGEFPLFCSPRIIRYRNLQFHSKQEGGGGMNM